MASKHRYQIRISNAYLGKGAIITGATKAEVQFKANHQLSVWSMEEARKREHDRLQAIQTQTRQQQQETKRQDQQQLAELTTQAEQSNQEAQEQQAALRELLQRGLRAETKFTWEAQKLLTPYPRFYFMESPPTYAQVAQMVQVPAPQPTREALLPGARKRREALEAEAQYRFSMLLAQYNARRAEAFNQHERQRFGHEQEQAQHNASIDEQRRNFEAGDVEAVIWVLYRTLEAVDLPLGYGKEFEAAFDSASGIAIITLQLPAPTLVPKITSYTFVKSKKTISPVEMKPKEFEALYDSLICQMALLTIHRIFRDVTTPALQGVVFNGYVSEVNRATGKDFSSCILSVQVGREAFQEMNLERVDPKECIRSLKGLMAGGSLAQLAPVAPIMRLDTADKRFVESREILESLEEATNLAVMDWEDFEHLVRELFSKEFGSSGSEVRVTQASRDGGVDAIAFDPDPIRGGKFVIQAKRYNKVVPVSAVRDLYGTMISEGAAKGILVTTSYFGNDAREFVKDKPISLLDGANLVYMLQKHGYNVTIQLQ